MDDLLAAISTGAFYFLANYHTYLVGSSVAHAKPLPDFFHEVLPDLGEHVKLRDWLLPLFFIPMLFVTDVWGCLRHFVEGFTYIITLKAITIFFTIIPLMTRAHYTVDVYKVVRSCRFPTIQRYCF